MESRNIFITREIPEAGLKLLRDAGHTLDIYIEKVELSQEELIKRCQGKDALLSAGPNKLDKTFLAACSHLKVIALYSVGYDHLDLETAKALKIAIGNTPGVLSAPTADTAFLLMLAASRKAIYLHKKIRKGEWNFYEPTANLGMDLRGKTLGIVGLGNIGFEMARLCSQSFQMKIVYHNRSRNLRAEEHLAAEYLSFDDLLKRSDVVSVHATLSPETKGLFNIEAFKKMKAGSIFINAGRGGLHVEKDLVKALQTNLIWGAGLDVTNPEPSAFDNPLLDMPTVAVLPHIGSATVEARDAMARMAAENILAGLTGKELPYPVK